MKKFIGLISVILAVAGLTPAAGANLPVTHWVGTFNLTVVKEALPAASTNAITISVGSGETASETVVLSNSGNEGINYNVTDDGTRPIGNYTVTTNETVMAPFDSSQFDPASVYTNGSRSIGFDMPVFGVKYSSFSVSQNGSLTLSSTDGKTATLKVFQTNVSSNSVRFHQSPTRLVIAWGNDTTTAFQSEFQAWLNADGTIKYLYKYGVGGSGAIGIQNNDHSQAITYTPGLVQRGSLLLTPAYWITYAPTHGNLSAQSSQILTFTANADGRSNGTHQFTATVNWGGSNSLIAVTVIVSARAPKLEVSNPFTFSGPLFTKAVMTVTNTGNVGLTYTITDSGLQTNGYTSSASSYDNNWISLFTDTLGSSQLGTEAVGLGFPFTFFGNTYSTAVVNQDGSISLGSGQTITPYSANLSFVDGVSSVHTFTDSSRERFVVTWENMAQPGGGSQTFQTILNRDGTIRFNYETMTGNWFDGTIQLTDPAGTVSGTLSNASTTVTSTNYVYQTNTTGSTTIGNVTYPGETTVTVIGTNVVKTYTDTANRQSIVFTPGQSQVIYATPTTATVLPAGGTADVTLYGDARGAGAGNYTTTLTFAYSGLSTNSAVTFTATNGVINPSDLWGGDPAVLSQKNPDNSYTLSWQTPSDRSSRIYKIWYTTRLGAAWSNIATQVNNYQYIDRDPVRNALPQIFYKVTVQ